MNVFFQVLWIPLLIVTASVAVGAEEGEVFPGPQEEGVVLEREVQYPPIGEFEAGGVQWTHSESITGAQSLRLHLRFQKVESGDYQIDVLDTSGRQVDSWTPSALAETEDAWTKTIPGDTYIVVVYGPDAPHKLAFAIDGVASDVKTVQTESKIGEDQRAHITDYDGEALPVVRKVQPSVAKIGYIKNGARRSCTGFLLSDSLLLTNEHCVNTAKLCKTAVASFGYQYNGTNLAHGVDYRCTELVKKSFELDYALLRIENSPGKKWGYLKLSGRNIAADERAFIIQHPAGLPKQISETDCRIRATSVRGRVPQVDFTHSCDTLGGSSGSPVLDWQGEVVGLHHFGRGGEFVNSNRAVMIKKISAQISGLE